MENPENREQEQISARERLKILELGGDVVFHGSPDLIEKLEPRQPYNFEEGKGIVEHGEPSVVATPFADIAIFRAIMRNETHSFGASKKGKADFKTTKEALEKVKTNKGFVYVLDKGGFKKLEDSPMEVRSQKEETAKEVIEVGSEDLPQNITIAEESEFIK